MFNNLYYSYLMIREKIRDMKYYAVPTSLTYMWNFGSLLIFGFIIQIVSGLLLACHYCPSVDMAFNSVSHIIRDVNYGWLIRNVHLNGASMIFGCLYIHIARGLYYGSYLRVSLWFSGVIMLILMMAIAFLGYVLPWGQMSFWGATVITNFFSAIPYIGKDLVFWIWGGYSVGDATLKRFYVLHFMLPFVMLSLIFLHIYILHDKGSNNPLGIGDNIDKVNFWPYYFWKDLVGICAYLIVFGYFVFFNPYILGDPENFNKANAMITPKHIVPEWYFLFAYAILRFFPTKLTGLLALVFSLVVLFIIPFTGNRTIKSNAFKPFSKFFFWIFIFNFIALTYLGSKPAEQPWLFKTGVSTVIYFLYLLVLMPCASWLDEWLTLSNDSYLNIDKK